MATGRCRLVSAERCQNPLHPHCRGGDRQPGVTKGWRMHSLWAPLMLAAVALAFQRLRASPSRNSEGNERTFRKHLEKSPVTPVPIRGSSKAPVSVTSQRLLIKGKPLLSRWESRAQPWFR